ncbi:MAG: proline dehydrogenase family protein [Acidobacteria bacterium]|nr:proline dehydrogenase family protein [Acidobacteriota bacterium]
MSVMRSVLLAISENRWMRSHGQSLWFVKRAARRFMPGENFEDMLAAAEVLRPQGIYATFTRLGENVSDWAEAEYVTGHYLGAIDRIKAAGIPCEPSVKPTQLGLDLDPERCFENLRSLAARAKAAGSYLWIDMEQSQYVEATLDLTRRLGAQFDNVGVCLQAYLHRSMNDLKALREQGIGVRLVKGAYKEPATVAMAKKADVDKHYFALAAAMLEPSGRKASFRPVFGTHDVPLIARIQAHAERAGVPARGVEVHMLYGIQRDEQLRLVKDGASVRVLIAYGTFWFPWYMRRLAERPANVWFVLKSLFT